GIGSGLAQLRHGIAHDGRARRWLHAVPDHLAEEPELHEQDQCEQGHQDAQHESNAGTMRPGSRFMCCHAHRAPAVAFGVSASAVRMADSTGAVSGMMPRQMRKLSAACSTSIPRPSAAAAPACMASIMKGVGRLPYTMS